MINNFSVSKIIECEHKAFKKTEAKTHIYHIRNVFSRKQSQIAFEKNGCEIYLSNMDFIFKNQFPDASEEFDDKFLLFRGKKSGKECRNSGLPYFHTTSFDSILTEKETNFNSYDGIALKMTF